MQGRITGFLFRAKGQRYQQGKVRRKWLNEPRRHALTFTYEAEHEYSHQGNVGTARLQRGVTVRFENASSAQTYRDGSVRFQFTVDPHMTWHVCVDVLPLIDGEELPSHYRCRSFGPHTGAYDTRRHAFLDTASTVSAPSTDTLTPVVIGALEQGKRDLVALRLHDFDHGDRGWTMAAGLPGKPRHDARHARGARTPAMLNMNPLRRYYGSITTSGFYPVVVSELWHWTGDKELVRPFLEPALRGLQWLEEYADADRGGWLAGRSPDRHVRGARVRLSGEAASLGASLVVRREG